MVKVTNKYGGNYVTQERRRCLSQKFYQWPHTSWKSTSFNKLTNMLTTETDIRCMCKRHVKKMSKKVETSTHYKIKTDIVLMTRTHSLLGVQYLQGKSWESSSLGRFLTLIMRHSGKKEYQAVKYWPKTLHFVNIYMFFTKLATQNIPRIKIKLQKIYEECQIWTDFFCGTKIWNGQHTLTICL